MLHLPAQLDLGPYTIHLDVLAARVRRQRRRIRQALLACSLLVALGLAAWLIIPLLRGSGTLVVPAYPAEVQLLLDGRTLPTGSLTLASGEHTVQAVRAGAFPAAISIQITRAQTTTLELPILRPIPRVQALPLPDPQSTWLQASPDAGSGWRLAATRTAPEQASLRPGWGQSQPPAVPYLLHLDAQGLTRLSVLETYPVADELTTAGGARFWAMWEPLVGVKPPGIAGNLTLTSPASTQIISTSVGLRGLWWAPGGQHLLAALPHDQGLDLVLVDARRPQINSRVPLITAPGEVQSIAWSPDGLAAVVVLAPAQSVPAQSGAPLPARPTPIADRAPGEGAALARNAVLVLLPRPGRPAQALRLRVPPARPANLIPLAWSAESLWWVTDTGLGLALDQVRLLDGAIERIGRLPDDLVALTALRDETLRVVRAQASGQLVVQRWPAAQELFALPAIQSVGPVGGSWHGDELLVATGPGALWYVTIEPEALQ